MENSALTALLLNRRCHTGTVGIAFGAGALLLAGAGVWGVNQASKARARGAEQAQKAYQEGQQEIMRMLASGQVSERASRESWQNTNTPTMKNYIDVAAGSGAASGANASSNSMSEALAAAIIAGNNGNGQVCPSPVALYNPATPFTGCCNG